MVEWGRPTETSSTSPASIPVLKDEISTALLSVRKRARKVELVPPRLLLADQDRRGFGITCAHPPLGFIFRRRPDVVVTYREVRHQGVRYVPVPIATIQRHASLPTIARYSRPGRTGLRSVPTRPSLGGAPQP